MTVKKQTSVMLDPRLKDGVRLLAAYERTTMSELIGRATEAYVEGRLVYDEDAGGWQRVLLNDRHLAPPPPPPYITRHSEGEHISD